MEPPSLATQHAAEDNCVPSPHPHREAGWQLWLTVTTQHLKGIVPHITSLKKGQTSKFKVQFLLNLYCFHTIIKPKICNLNYSSTEVRDSQ
jgi:hypothetical protein